MSDSRTPTGLRRDHLRSDAVVESVERPWLDLLSASGAVAVRDALLVRGVPACQAAGMAIWLADQQQRRRAVTAGTALKYRRTLRDIGAP